MAKTRTQWQPPPQTHYFPETPEEWQQYDEWQRTRLHSRIKLLERALGEVVNDPWHASGIAHAALIELRELRRRQDGYRWEPRP